MLSARLTQSIAKQTRGLKTSAIRRSDDVRSNQRHAQADAVADGATTRTPIDNNI